MPLLISESKSVKSNEIFFMRALGQINWNFQDEATNSATHDFHPYPAKFIPQIPYHLIKIFTNEGETVYDPFCGCGTTIVESILENRRAIGNDMNPSAVLISKVKATVLSYKQMDEIKKTVIDIEKNIANLYKSNIVIKKRIPSNNFGIPNLTSWFDAHVIVELSMIKNVIESVKDRDMKDFLKVALSSIIVSVSYQDSNTRYVRVNKNIPQKETIRKFKLKIYRMMEKIEDLPVNAINPKVVIADTRLPSGLASDSADLAVTSPPYPNAYDYHLYHKYRMYWLDMDPLDLKRNEIGSHANYSKKNGHTYQNFEDDMRKSFIQIAKILKPNKYFCIVIGDSIIKGEKIHNNELLKRISAMTPFEFIYEAKRDIQLSKKSFNPRIGNIKTEHIMVFKNCK